MFIEIFTLSAVAIGAALSQGASPCPKTFTYEPRNPNEQDRWYGVVSLKTDEDLEGVFLKIQLDRPADLLGNWFGEVSSSDNLQFSINNPKYRLEAGPPVSVRFFVKYNAATIIPTVKKILLNGRTVCSSTVSPEKLKPTAPTLHISKPETGSPETPNKGTGKPTVSKIPTRHQSNNSRPGSSNVPSNSIKRPGGSSNELPNRRPANTDVSYDDEDFGDFGGVNRRTTTTKVPDLMNIRDEFGRPVFVSDPSPNQNQNSNHDRPRPNNGLNIEIHSDEDNEESDFFSGDLINVINRPSLNRPNTLQSHRQQQCGTVNQRPNALVSHGQETSPGQWPWHAALYHSRGIQLMYTCGGTLISDSYIVTAAHCVTRPQTDRPVNKKYLLVYLGKYNLLTFGPEVQDRAIEEIYVHPQYNYSVYFNDIALLKLVKPVELTNFVRPCCLWEGDTDLESILNRQGTVVGWGFDENRQLSRQLMQAQMPIVSTVKCIYSNREFFSQFTFENNYCAGFRNGTSVCNGDSGGGMVFPRPGTSGQNTVWQLRGIVSVGVALQSQGVCDTSHYIIFTDVAKYLPWIRQLIGQRRFT